MTDPKDRIAAAHLAKTEGAPTAEPDPDVMGWLEDRFGVEPRFGSEGRPPTYEVDLECYRIAMWERRGRWEWVAVAITGARDGDAEDLHSATEAAASAAIEALESDLERLRSES